MAGTNRRQVSGEQMGKRYSALIAYKERSTWFRKIVRGRLTEVFAQLLVEASWAEGEAMVTREQDLWRQVERVIPCNQAR
jgi:hypothetical protein